MVTIISIIYSPVAPPTDSAIRDICRFCSVLGCEIFPILTHATPPTRQFPDSVISSSFHSHINELNLVAVPTTFDGKIILHHLSNTLNYAASIYQMWFDRCDSRAYFGCFICILINFDLSLNQIGKFGADANATALTRPFWHSNWPCGRDRYHRSLTSSFNDSNKD